MSTKDSAVETKSQHRLPTTAVPSFYDIRVEPDLAAATFTGEERVLLDLTEPLTQLVLNAAELQISEAVLTDDNGTRLVGNVTLDEINERAIITFDGTAGSGHWELFLKFSGILNDKLRGFYRSKYTNNAGGDEYIATTKFEPTDARRAFPCWDEPAFKARFKIALVIDAALSAVSNARLLKESPVPGGKKLLEFAPTIKMSTYLVAYIVGKLESSKAVVADGTEIRVWAVPGKKHLSSFALAAAKYSLEYFARYFNKPYPGDKLDLVAIPDFASGAMENFGCITFRETALLVDEGTASHAELERVAEVVAHENAHMWFGDFVTMSWWNGLWLNEAFATFMAAKAVDDWKPEWKVWDNFNVDRSVALRVDGLLSTRPIEFAVNHPDEARAMFDVLTYQKGCAVLRMLELFLGEHQFRLGIVEFLDRHQFANADTPDLWAALEDETADFSDTINITALMNTWVFQPGYPVVSVEESPVTGSIVLKQQLFKYLGDEGKEALWHVPVSVRAQTREGLVEKTVLLSKPSQTFYLGEDVSFVVVNAGGNGFFRVNYSPALASKLMSNLGLLTPSERFNLVGDTWAAVLSGSVSLESYLCTVTALTGDFGETDVNVFTLILGSLHAMRRAVWSNEASRQGLLGLARTLIQPALNKLGWEKVEGESSQTAQLRASLISTLGTFGDAEVQKRAAELFRSFKSNRAAVDSNLVPAVVETLASNGEQSQYDEFVSLRDASETPQDEQRFQNALGSFREEKLLAATLQRCLNGDVRTQDAPFLVRSIMMNPAGAKLAWDFVKDNWDAMVKAYPPSALVRMCEGITGLVDVNLEREVGQFFAEHKVKGGDKAVAQYLELLRIAVAFAEREKSWLNQRLTT